MKTPLRINSVPVLSVFLLYLALGDLHAQALTKIFVASYGNDANDGSRGSPKRNFQAAHDTVSAGGEVDALDTAGYGLLTIGKSITITCPPGVTGLITTAANGAAAITVNAGGSDTVALRGLTLENTGNSDNGIYVASVGTLNVSDCVIQNFSFIGLYLISSTPASLLMTRCKVRNCTYTAVVAGSTGVALTATLESCQFESSGAGFTAYLLTKVMAHDCVAAGNLNNGFSLEQGASGVLLACTAANNKSAGVAANINGTLTVQGCAIFGNLTGVDAGSGGQITLLNCAVSANGTAINAGNNGAAVRFDACAITDNTTAYAIGNSQSASISSRGNNTVAHNTNTGSIGTYTPQ